MENLKLKDNSNQSFKFSVMPSFWLLAIVAILSKNGYVFGVYTISVLIHEFAHFFVAKKLRYKCNSINLSAFGAVLYGEFEDVDGVDGAKIALAGPLTNLLLVIFVVALWWMFPVFYTLTYDFAVSNFSLACINFLPCYPLDGGRILVALLRKKQGYSKAIKISRFFSVSLGCIFFALFIAGIFCRQNLYSCGLFGFFLTLTGMGESKRVIYEKKIYLGANRNLAKRGMEKKCLVFDGENTLRDVVKKLKDNCFYQLTVLLGEGEFFLLEQPQINSCLLAFTLDTPLKNLIKYKI